MEMVYWRHPSCVGIKIEEVSGGEEYGPKIWLEMARQIYCENGKEAYREIGHFASGVPFLFGETSRISISHCEGLFVVATLPATPEVSLDSFTPRAALGVDAERADRAQVLRVRERFLSDAEQAMIAADDVEMNVLAWTIKEAAYKAALSAGVDFRQQIQILRIPRLSPPTPVFKPEDYGLAPGTTKLPDDFFGLVKVEDIELMVYSYRSDECLVTLAYHRQCAKF